MKSAETVTVSGGAARANEPSRSSESARSKSVEPSGGVLSRETVKVYVPETGGVKAGRTARTPGA